jgi:choline-sulfatase
MNGFWGPFTQAPNLLILVSDQQRTAQYLPAGWVENNLPNLWTLIQSGVTFPNGMTNATACSPSRATLWTSTYPMINGVTYVGATLNLSTHPNLTTLGLALARYKPANVIYNVAYKGKWHLTQGFQSELTLEQQKSATNRAAQTANDNVMNSTYGFPQWTSQDFGTVMMTNPDTWKEGEITIPTPFVNTLGGGGGGNDQRVATGTSYITGGEVDSAKDWLTSQMNNAPNNPFCLVVSLLNPHDIFVSPGGYASAGYVSAAIGPDEYPWRVAPFTEISLPDSYHLSESDLANKPSMQTNLRWSAAQGSSEEELRRVVALDYLRFYAYLETLSDALLGEIMSVMTGNQPVMNNTLIVRLADHGEMGMSQGGMVQKELEAYNEALLVPMVFSNPGLPQGKACTGLAGLIDVLPTIAEICQLNIPSNITLQGVSLGDAILAEDSGSTYGRLLFATDDAGVIIRALIDTEVFNAKYVVSSPNLEGTSWQCELYDFLYTPDEANPWSPEMVNKIPVDGLGRLTIASTIQIQQAWRQMHIALTTMMEKTGTTPPKWPSPPISTSLR